MCGWLNDNTTYTNATLGTGYAVQTNTASATAVTASFASGTYILAVNGVVAVKFTYDVPASATLNIDSKGAKLIYYRGATITDDVIKAGDTATFVYNGTNYILIAIDRAAQEVVISETEPDATDISTKIWVQL
mgnify:CR=1 FL=1